MSETDQPQETTRQRIDKWLFFTRLVKSRTLAQGHVQSGHVRVNGEKVLQPSHVLRAGDRVELALERRDLVVLVKAGGSRRGPYEEARLLYEDVTPPDETKRLTPFEQAVRGPGAGRPTNRERRALDRLIGPED